MNYYFLAPSLPPLELGHIPDITSEELFARFKMNLTKEDMEKAQVLRRFTDINNIRALALEEPIDNRGNLNEKELDEALLTHDIFPLYVFDFLDKYETPFQRLKYFSELLSRFFIEETDSNEGFLKRYLTFEREWRLVLAALRAKQRKKEILKELQFEDFKDPIVAQILAQKDEKDYEPPLEYADLKQIYLSCGEDPWQQYKSVQTWRFNKIEELVEHPSFSIDWILAYVAKLMIVEQWNELDEEKGLMILDTIKASEQL